MSGGKNDLKEMTKNILIYGGNLSDGLDID